MTCRWFCCHPQPGCWVTNSCLPVCCSPPVPWAPRKPQPAAWAPPQPVAPPPRRGPQQAGGPLSAPAELQVRVVLGGVWGASSATVRPHLRTSSAELRVRRCLRHALGAPDATHGSPHTAQLPPFTDCAGACAGWASGPANPRGPRHQHAPSRPCSALGPAQQRIS